VEARIEYLIPASKPTPKPSFSVILYLLIQMIKREKTQYHHPDYFLIIIFSLILIFGLVVLTSASSAAGFEKFDDSYYFIKQQLLHGFVPGIILLVLLSFINYQKWKKLIFPLLIASIILLISVFLPGIGAQYGGAKSWINLGPFSFQPAELVKLTFILYLAIWLSKKEKEELKKFSTGFLPFLVILGVISLLIALQPDIGTLFVILSTALIVYFSAGARFSHLFLTAAGGGSLLFLLIKISPYRTARLTTFLHPELDPQGIGYHINQAFLAIGSGGLFGRGFGHSRQKFLYLPEVTGDSIFAIVCEELGYIFALILIGLFLLLFIRIIKIAKECDDPFGKLLAIGIASWFTIQAFLNISAMIGIAPLTGIPLPFVSHGGTALAIGMAAVGILINMSRQVKD